MPDTKSDMKPAAPTRRSANVWSDEERAAMKESARERKASARRSPEEERAEGARDVLAKIAELPEPDRSMAEGVHRIVTAAAPNLVPRTYYGMPAYSRDGKVLCFFKPKSKFKERYSTFGFETNAPLDDGVIWPVAFAVMELTPDAEARIVQLVKKAAG
ncbi:MAG TPA: hypothetical protein VFI28_03450 [Candidatus Limnocylindrales bacterium]|nr:hypothetical protein [Candidatus Limnocylindrales bacterium]